MHEVLARIRPPVVRYCRSRLLGYSGGIDGADDVAQETCVAVFQMLPNYQDQGAPFMAWVYRIAANKVADAQRRLRRSAVPVEEIPERVEPSPTPEERLLAAATLDAAEELLEALPVRMQQVLVLRAAGTSMEGIATALGTTPSAARVLHHRASHKLRRLFREREESA